MYLYLYISTQRRVETHTGALETWPRSDATAGLARSLLAFRVARGELEPFPAFSEARMKPEASPRRRRPVVAGPTDGQRNNYTLWISWSRWQIHTQAGNYADFSYWGPATTAAGCQQEGGQLGTAPSESAPRTVAFETPSTASVLGATGATIAATSAGDLQNSGYALSLYGGSTRYKKSPTPNASGVCGNLDGTTQTGWNIKWVDVASGASGGSELADYGLLGDERASGERPGHHHRAGLIQPQHHRSLWLYPLSREPRHPVLQLLPGQDDEAVAYHSTGGVSGSAGQVLLQPRRLVLRRHPHHRHQRLQ